MKRGLFVLLLLAFISQITYSSYAQMGATFGKNKVQYQKFNWKYIETAHFDIYYYDGGRRLAEFTARAGEDALISIQKTLNYNLTKRVPIIVYNTHNEFQQTNVFEEMMPEGVGGVTELFKNRVVIPFQGDYSQYRHVVHHELVHAVLNDMFYGGTFQSALSTGNAVQIPGWMNEGLAEYESIGGMDTQTDMFMRDLALSESLYPLEYLGGYLAYRGGQTFYWYVGEKYGKERVGDLINRLRIYGDVDAAFRSSFHMSLADFSEQWIKDMKKYYWPDIGKYKDPEDFSTRLTNHKKIESFYNSSPSISPEGERMAFLSDRDGVLAVYIQDLNNKEKVEKLVSSARTKDFEQLNLLTPGISWNPAGTQIAISAKAGGEEAVFIVDVKSGDYDKLSFGLQSITSVNWSPNGEKLAFIASKEGRSDIYIYTFATKQLSNITDDVFSDFHPVWAPDSKTLYFVSDRNDYITGVAGNLNFKMWNENFNSADIYSIDTETRIIRRITHEPDYSKSSIAVSSDGSKLLYTSDKNGISNIYEYNLQTNGIRPLTNSLNGITQLSLARDDAKLLYCTQKEIGFDIFQINNPFSVRIEGDTIPVTSLRQRFLQRQQLSKNLNESNLKGTTTKDTSSLTGYGNYNIEFDRQKAVKPNPDVEQRVTSNNNNGAVKGENPAADTNYVEHEYKLKFTPDLIVGNPGYSTYFGFQGVAQALISDIMGDHQLLLAAYLLSDLRNSSFMASYWYLPELIDYNISAYHTAYSFAILKNPPPPDSSNELPYDYFRFRNWGVNLSASYPFDLFNRLEWGISWMNLSKENILKPDSGNISRMLFVPQGRFVHDDVLWGYFAPVEGTRYFVSFMGTPKIGSSGIGFMTATADYRRYFTVTNYFTLALRGSLGASFGPNPQTFFLGGLENWINSSFNTSQFPFNNPEDFAFMQFEMPLRGFEVNERRGSQFFLMNGELRFPLIRALIAGPIPILLQSIMGTIFLDVGGAWSGPLNSFKSAIRDTTSGSIIANDLLMSAGVGVRTYLLGLPLKMDVAWRNNFSGWSVPIYLFSLGYDF